MRCWIRLQVVYLDESVVEESVPAKQRRILMLRNVLFLFPNLLSPCPGTRTIPRSTLSLCALMI